MEIIEFGQRLKWTGHPNERDLGDVLHRILAAEILNPNRPDRDGRTKAILTAFGLDGNLPVTDVLTTVDRYGAFVAERFRPVIARVEIPIAMTNSLGQRINGFIDHLLETPEGAVIIDHKIFPGRRSEWGKTALGYSGQLAFYRDAGLSAYPSVSTVAIHLVTSGALVKIEMDDP